MVLGRLKVLTAVIIGELIGIVFATVEIEEL